MNPLWMRVDALTQCIEQIRILVGYFTYNVVIVLLAPNKWDIDDLIKE